MTIATETEGLDAPSAEVAGRKRLGELRAEVLGLAVRFAREGSGEAGAELASALKECVKACEGVLRDVIAAREQLGPRREQLPVEAKGEGARLREEHSAWMMSVRARLLEDAADAHREAEIARRANVARGARRWFGIKNRAEAVAVALRDVIGDASDRVE